MPNGKVFVVGGNAGGAERFDPEDPVPGFPGFSYTPAMLVFTAGSPIPEVAPDAYGNPSCLWSISPSLPAGLVFDSFTGTLRGVPAEGGMTNCYQVTCSNVANTSVETIWISVQP